MTATTSRIKQLIAILGALLMMAGVGAVAHSTQPTEASWADQVRGAATFGTHPDLGRNYARAITGNGRIKRQISTYNVGPVRALSTPRTGGSEERLEYDETGALGALPLEVSGRSCASTSSTLPQCAVGLGLSPGTSYASSEVSRLKLSVANLRTITNISYGTSGKQASIAAVATCVPGETGRAEATAGGPVLLKDEAPMYLPAPNHQTSASYQSGTGFTSGTLQYRRDQGPGWARAEVRLYVTSDETLANYSFHIVLASAECGIGRITPGEPVRPTTSRPEPLPESPNVPSSRAAAMPALLRSGADVADAAEEQTPDSPPALDDETYLAAGDEDAPAPKATAASAAETTMPKATENEAAKPETTKTGTTRPALTGTARIDDITRTPGCGVELTLTITTSVEAGPGRWASIGPSDFTEVLPGESLREATRVSPACESASNSRTTVLSPGRDYVVVVAFQLADSAQRAMLRPAGTTGWVFDLPSLPPVSATPNPSSQTTQPRHSTAP